MMQAKKVLLRSKLSNSSMHCFNHCIDWNIHNSVLKKIMQNSIFIRCICICSIFFLSLVFFVGVCLVLSLLFFAFPTSSSFSSFDVFSLFLESLFFNLFSSFSNLFIHVTDLMHFYCTFALSFSNDLA